MTSELVYRMRTCAAALMVNSGNANTPFQRMYCDAAELLAEASNLLDEPEPLGELMPKLPPVASPGSSVTWTTLDLPNVVPRPCPFCGSIDARTARINKRQLMLTCPKCSQSWEYKP